MYIATVIASTVEKNKPPDENTMRYFQNDHVELDDVTIVETGSTSVDAAVAAIVIVGDIDEYWYEDWDDTGVTVVNVDSNRFVAETFCDQSVDLRMGGRTSLRSGSIDLTTAHRRC